MQQTRIMPSKSIKYSGWCRIHTHLFILILFKLYLKCVVCYKKRICIVKYGHHLYWTSWFVQMKNNICLKIYLLNIMMILNLCMILSHHNLTHQRALLRITFVGCIFFFGNKASTVTTNRWFVYKKKQQQHMISYQIWLPVDLI